MSERHAPHSLAPDSEAMGARPYRPLLLRLRKLPGVRPITVFLFCVILTPILSRAFDIAVGNTLQLGYVLGVTFYLVGFYRSQLQELRPHLDVTDAEFLVLDYNLTHFNRMKFWLWSLLGPAIFIFVNAGSSSVRQVVSGGELNWRFVVAALFATFVWTVIVQCWQIIFNALRIFRHMSKARIRVNLLNVDPLVPLSRVGIRTLLILTAAYSVIPIIMWTDSLKYLGPALLSLIITLPLCIAVFFIPVTAIVKRVKALKAKEIDLINRALAGDISALASTNLDQKGQKIGQIDLLSYRDYIDGVRNWPIDGSGVLRIFIYVILPIASWTVMTFANTIAGTFIRDTILPVLQSIF